jgi:hypothetical protein
MNKEREVIILNKKNYKSIVYDDYMDIDEDNFVEFETVDGTEKIIDEARWTTTYEKIIKRLPDGKFFYISWDSSKNECDTFDDANYGNTSYELKEVFPVDKVVIVYE